MTTAVATTSRRLPNGWHELHRGATVVGQAWRWQPRADGTRAKGWGLRLNGYFWRRGEANTISGSTTVCVSSLGGARTLADKVLGGQQC